MAYSVELSRRAQHDIAKAFEYIRRDAPLNAVRWRRRLEERLRVLEQMPESFGFAPENHDAKADVRHILFGRYRILYTIRERTVFVLTVRHGARVYLSGPDLDATV